MKEMDPISDLPIEIVHNILMHMPIVDAVRTSILSRKWRYCCTELPELVFDDHFYERFLKRMTRMLRTSLKSIVQDVLTYHSGPLRRFVFSIPLQERFYWTDVDAIIRLVSKKGAQNVEILMPIFNESYYKMPSYLFFNDQLQTLKLSHVECKVPVMFSGCPKLSSVDFENVAIDPSFFQNFVNKCSRIERMRLQDISILNNETCSININAPHLRFFRYAGEYGSICFGNAPMLEEICVYNQNGGSSPLYANIGQLSALKRLHCDFQFIQGLSMSTKFRLNALVHVGVSRVPFGDTIAAACLHNVIAQCPRLERLAMQIDDMSTDCISFRLVYEESSKSCKQVDVWNFRGTMVEVELIKLLLHNLMDLEKMRIAWSSSMAYRRGAAVLKAPRASVMKEIVEFPAASDVEVIIYETY